MRYFTAFSNAKFFQHFSFFQGANERVPWWADKQNPPENAEPDMPAEPAKPAEPVRTAPPGKPADTATPTASDVKRNLNFDNSKVSLQFCCAFRDIYYKNGSLLSSTF